MEHMKRSATKPGYLAFWEFFFHLIPYVSPESKFGSLKTVFFESIAPVRTPKALEHYQTPSK